MINKNICSLETYLELAEGVCIWWCTSYSVCIRYYWNPALWRACNLTLFSPCLTCPVDYLFASRHKGPRFKSPGGYLCETRILLLAFSRYIGAPLVIDHHCGLVWGGPRPKLSLGPRTDNVIILLDLTQFSCPVSRSLQVSLPASQPTKSAAGGEPCREPAISLHSHHVSLV